MQIIEEGQTPALEIKRLTIKASGTDKVIVDNINLTINSGELLAIIGESGSGKSTIALACSGLVRTGLDVSRGEVLLAGKDLLTMGKKELASTRGSQVCYVAQSAASAFNPALRLNRQVTEASIIRKSCSYQDALTKAISLYKQLSLPNPKSIGSRYPHQVSGGQLQRFMIAMGLMEEPGLMVFDEPTSALDVTTQIEVLIAIRNVVQKNNNIAGL